MGIAQTMEAHFVDVGMGNMVVILLSTGQVFVVDCNITDANEARVLGYLRKILGSGTRIDKFINTHRDADHIRGIDRLHGAHRIQTIWDTGVPGTTTTSTEYRSYMSLLRDLPSRTIQMNKRWTFGSARFRCWNASRVEYNDANDQSMVWKIEYANSSLLLAGDTTFRPWKEHIVKRYGNDLRSNILLAAHHGSITFLDDPSDSRYYYTDHLEKIKPAMTLISVGPNVHGLPDEEALGLYTKYSTGSSKGNKVYTTQDEGTMRLILKGSGKWTLSVNQ